MNDRLSELWGIQSDQQKRLGLDPGEMDVTARRTLTTELVALLHEEVTDLGRIAPTYKRHVLRTPSANPMDAAEAAADVLKLLVAWSQLQGLDPEQIMAAFRRKTDVVQARFDSEQVTLAENTRLLAVDVDDVIVDISEFRRQLAKAKATIGSTAEVHTAEETFKDAWYRSGAFYDCPPIEGGPEALRAARHAGFTIAAITARPQWQYKRIQGDTMSWFARWGVPYDVLLFNRNKAEALFDLRPAWPVAFVEDHLRNATELAAIGVPVLLFDAPHNQQVEEQPNITRVKGWSAVRSRLGI